MGIMIQEISFHQERKSKEVELLRSEKRMLKWSLELRENMIFWLQDLQFEMEQLLGRVS